jgi:hypothetical protein
VNLTIENRRAHARRSADVSRPAPCRTGQRRKGSAVTVCGTPRQGQPRGGQNNAVPTAWMIAEGWTAVVARLDAASRLCAESGHPSIAHSIS